METKSEFYHLKDTIKQQDVFTETELFKKEIEFSLCL